MDKIRAISLYGGPACGKSTIMSKLFADLKIQGHSVELSPEVIKPFTYMDYKIQGYDQMYIHALQMRQADIYLRGCDFIVTDCSPTVNLFYAYDYKYPYADGLKEIVKVYDKQYPSLHIFIDAPRVREHYQEAGRFHTFDEAVSIDKAMLEFMTDFYGEDGFVILPRNYDEILEFVEDRLWESGDMSTSAITIEQKAIAKEAIADEDRKIFRDLEIAMNIKGEKND